MVNLKIFNKSNKIIYFLIDNFLLLSFENFGSKNLFFTLITQNCMKLNIFYFFFSIIFILKNFIKFLILFFYDWIQN